MASVLRRLSHLEARTPRVSCVVRPTQGQTSADAIARHLRRFGPGAGKTAPAFVVVPLPSLSTADWLAQHAPPPP